MVYIRYMGGKQPTHHTQPQRTMFFPHSVNQQLIVDMANSCKKTIDQVKPYSTRTNGLDEQFAKRVHELMRFRSHTVDTDGF